MKYSVVFHEMNLSRKCIWECMLPSRGDGHRGKGYKVLTVF